KTYDDMVRFEIDIKDIEKSKFTGYRYSGQLSPGGSVILDADSGKDALYKFYVMQVDEGKVETIKEYGPEDKVTWKPKKAGKYKVEMWVKNKYSDTKTYDDMVRFEIDVRGMASQFEAYNYIGNTNVNSKIKFSAKSDKDALFKFFIKHQNDSNFSVIKDYNEMSSVEWIPRKSGTYMIEMWVKNKQSSTLNYDQKVSFNINIANFEVKDLGFKFDFGLSGPSPNNPNKLVLHHAAGNSTASSVHDFHRFTNGWAGIGYHFYIHKDGTIYKGRDESWRGAHAAEVGPDDGNLNNDTNATSLGIAVQGNYHPTGPTPSNSMPKAQEDAVVKLGRHLVQKYGLTQIFKHGSPGIGHTSCPGDYYPFARIKARILDGFVYGIDSDNLDQVTD
ncbi:MAG: N-acetylmuramoyl-L-alanine amidase, partial [Sarcina sp.]